MLRADYIALSDIEKLKLLSLYYVDSFGYLDQILSDSDQLIVGRRGTGKTTLLYRAFVECMDSWDASSGDAAKARKLGIYIDLSKCSSIDADDEFRDFEHAFVSELYEAISDQLRRFWPTLSEKASLLERLFRGRDAKRKEQTNSALQEFISLLTDGVPRTSRKSNQKVETFEGNKSASSGGIDGGISSIGAEIGAHVKDSEQSEISKKQTVTVETESRLTIADILRTLGEIRERAGISSIILFVDEFSALTPDLQRRFSTLLRKILGSHAGIFVKLSAITDNYTLGTSIILQRDLFELSLDLDAYVERSHGLSHAMAGLTEQASRIIEKRLAAYACPPVADLFQEPEESLELLSREAIGVPRTLGIVLQQAWNNCKLHGNKIKKSDVEYGIRYASTAYVNQMLGASKGGVAIPAHVSDLWYALIRRASQERTKERRPASHFLVQPQFEEALKYLNMFFLLHLLTKGRTTKKDSASRSLYCFDYGVCLENNLDYTTDKNVIRQQRFAYDDVIQPYIERYYAHDSEQSYQCPTCGTIYKESEIQVAGRTLVFCPQDRADLQPLAGSANVERYTEEEIKIIGAIRSASRGDTLVARRIADDVGCYVQKVAKFGEKLEKEDVIEREKKDEIDKFIYFKVDAE